MLRLAPPEKLDLSKPQEWPDWKQHFERFICARKLNAEGEVLEINALTYTIVKTRNTYLKSFQKATKISTPQLLGNSMSFRTQEKYFS